VVIVALALGLALGIQAFLIKPYQIPSGSMEPTLDVGQRVLVNRFIYHFTSPKIGDIVVFHPPAGAERGNECGVPRTPDQPCPRPTPQQDSQNFIMPCQGGSACNLPKAITVPPGHYFMMGDNRGSSDDSRFWGPVPQGWFIGKAFATYWPPDRIGIL
jgi:signal peptidase I